MYLNNLKFLHADPNDFEMVDNLTAKGGRYIFLVDTYGSTPVTVYRENDRLVTEAIMYETGTTNPLAIVKADVTDGGLENIAYSPAPGREAADPVPVGHINVLKRPDLVQRMRAAGELLDGDDEAENH